MLKTKLPAYVSVLTLCVGGAVVALFFGFARKEARLDAPTTVKAARNCVVNVDRIKGYNGIKPLLKTEHACESPRYGQIKGAVRQYIEEVKSIGAITEAGFYLRDFEGSEWTEYNGRLPFEPGSLMKVPLMMTYLRMMEKDPSLMSKRFNLPFGAKPPGHVFFPPKKSAEPGKSYSLAQLLDLAMRYSDNLAVSVLLNHVEMAQFHRTYSDLGLRAFSEKTSSYPISPMEYSVFMSSLYGATYLSLDDSEWAISLMMDSDFDQGLKAGLPQGTRLAHKFGESYDGKDFHLHETGLIYVGDDAYLLTVMSKGTHMQALPGVLASVSELVFREMARIRGVNG